MSALILTSVLCVLPDAAEARRRSSFRAHKSARRALVRGVVRQRWRAYRIKRSTIRRHGKRTSMRPIRKRVRYYSRHQRLRIRTHARALQRASQAHLAQAQALGSVGRTRQADNARLRGGVLKMEAGRLRSMARY